MVLERSGLELAGEPGTYYGQRQYLPETSTTLLAELGRARVIGFERAAVFMLDTEPRAGVRVLEFTAFLEVDGRAPVARALGITPRDQRPRRVKLRTATGARVAS